MSYLFPVLNKKAEIDDAIREVLDKVVVLRFGRSTDSVCLQQDEVLMKCSVDVSRMAEINLIDVDAAEVQPYVSYFDITYIPATLFFFNAEHMKMDAGTPDNTKFIGAFHRKQDFVDVVEVLYRGAMQGKHIVTCPIPRERIPKFDLLYKDM